MTFRELLRARRSIRAFKGEPIEPEHLTAVLEAANLAPSAGNLQGYEIYVVRAAEQRLELARAAGGQEYVAQAPVVLAFCANPARSVEKYGERGARLYCVQDATIACTYAMLAAADLGYGTVWVGSFDEDQVWTLLEAPEGVRPVALLPIGRTEERPNPRMRRALEDLVHEVDG